MELLLDKLQQNFGLNAKHAMILRSLEHGPLNAKQLCLKTDIPQGRIYQYLNFLSANNLIDKSPKKPFVYRIHNINRNVLKFMKQRIDSLVNAQGEVMDLMQGPSVEHIEIVHNSKKFTLTHINMISESKRMRYMVLHNSFPYALYPMDYPNFIRLRRAIVSSRPTITHYDPQIATLVHRTYHDAFNIGKCMDVILEKKAFDFHVKVICALGNEFFTHWKKELIKRISKNNINLYILDDYIPMQMDVNNRRVNISMRHLGVTNGIVISSPNVTKFYNTIFDQNCRRARNLLPILKRLRFSGKRIKQSHHTQSI